MRPGCSNPSTVAAIRYPNHHQSRKAFETPFVNFTKLLTHFTDPNHHQSRKAFETRSLPVHHHDRYEDPNHHQSRKVFETRLVCRVRLVRLVHNPTHHQSRKSFEAIIKINCRSVRLRHPGRPFRPGGTAVFRKIRQLTPKAAIKKRGVEFSTSRLVCLEGELRISLPRSHSPDV